MKCSECEKKIEFDYYVARTSSGSNGGKLRLIFRCDCGSYMAPFDLVQIGKGKGLVSLEKFKFQKIEEDRILDGKKLSQVGLRIYNKHGIEAYEKWQKEVFLPLMHERIKKLRAGSAG